MYDHQSPAHPPLERVEKNRKRVTQIRERAHQLFVEGTSGISIASDLAEATDAFLTELVQDVLSPLDVPTRRLIEQHAAVVAIGGSGRGEMAPYSDIDLLFLLRGPARSPFTECASQVVRDCWDSGMKLGHSIRTVRDARIMARQEPQFATALVEARLLWGNRDLFRQLRRHFYRKVVHRRLRTFVDDCIQAREQERAQHGYTVQRLEPDVKRSLGGLRDIHLIRWVGFAHYKSPRIDRLRRVGAISKNDARALQAAHEFLTRIRIDLHFAAGKSQDVLSREEQLRIAEQRQIDAPDGQRPVERFMQTYFHHSTSIANIAERFVARHRGHSPGTRLKRFMTSHRADGLFKVNAHIIDALPKHRKSVCGSAEGILKLYRTVALTGLAPAPELVDTIKQSIGGLDPTISSEAVDLFREILGRSAHLDRVLRSMYDTGLLEFIIPEMAHARCLLQFNQYHSYTVDEHTLRAVDAATQFEHDDTPIGAAYRAIHHKDILHLALLLHDLGKGYNEDHSEVGRRIAERVAKRFQLSEHQQGVLVFLVHKHLLMSHLAFRRNIDDPEILIQFAHEVGSPEVLRMLYVLTAADISAVGPDVWTGWKAELLSELFDRTLLILSGKGHRFHEEERLQRIKQQVRDIIVPVIPQDESLEQQWDWVERQLDAFPSHYLMATSPDRIAADLNTIQHLQPAEIRVEGHYDGDEVGTVEYRILLDQELSSGCFHKITGVLAARRLEILSAQICTCLDGTVVDSFRVIDNDYAGQVPQMRIEEVATSLRDVLTGRTTVKALFQRYRRFEARSKFQPVSNLPTRVVVDNDSSDRCTILDVFAHDRPGLLYQISRAIYKLDLSIMLAKIATHVDQVVDVFYVTDLQGHKIKDAERLAHIRRNLEFRLQKIEQQGTA